jgi:MurNAc alpha-1-phosphate uridylyltransferase
MKAMILAAGLGRRLAPLTNHTPKPLLPIAGEPLLVRQIRQLSQASYKDIVINLHHLGAQIETTLGDGSALGVNIQYSHEDILLDTGGGIVKALPMLGNAPFVVLNGDILTNFDFTDLPNDFTADTLGHLVVTEKPASRDHGDFNLNNQRITERGDDWVYCGIAVLDPRLFINAPQGAFSLRDIYFSALAKSQLSAQIHSGHWTDIGDLEEYAAVRDGGFEKK